VRRADTIRGLERGLQVIELLEANPMLSLQELHRATRISKPSLLRVLTTLERAGRVSRRLADGYYHISAFGRTARKQDRYDRVAEAAAPVLNRLCQKVLWPSDLLVPAGNHMERRESNRPRSAFRIPPAGSETREVGQPVGWLLTAVGRAYLAYCPAVERDRILQRLRNSDKPEDRLARDPKRFDKVLAETRARGYAIRDPAYIGGFYGGPPHRGGTAAIAVPLVDRTRVHGSINILWISMAFTVEEFVAHHLADLQAAAHEIVDSLRSPTNRNPER
jgi:IclR family transcriptional regulator, mhp operon transcriptional activator